MSFVFWAARVKTNIAGTEGSKLSVILINLLVVAMGDRCLYKFDREYNAGQTATPALPVYLQAKSLASYSL